MKYILEKIKEILQLLKNTLILLISHKKLWGFLSMRKLNNLIKILKANYSSIQIVISALKFKNIITPDKQYLLTTIKKNSHQVEKLIFFPENHLGEKKKNLNYFVLKNSLAEWSKRGYEETEPIKWARKVLEDYENYFPEMCPNCRIIVEAKNNTQITPKALLSLLKSRKSRRFYSNKLLNENQKNLLVESANLAPTSCNRQTLRIIFIENPDLKKYVAEKVPGGKIFFNNAPTIMLVIVDKRDYRYPDGIFTPFQDSAAAIQNILIMAETMNLACCWGSLTSFGDLIDDSDFRRKFNIPEYFLITGSIAIGPKTHEVQHIPRDNVKSRYSINKFYWDNN